jgi:peptidoglycan/LPS O-acetylase OafA/YrhL
MGKKSSFHIPSLDGIRAVALLIVFISHAGLELVPGGFGVTIFFFLSGYLITTLLRVENEQTGRISLSGFYLRRTLRIFPPLYLVIPAVYLLGSMTTQEYSPQGIVAQLSYVTNYYIVNHGPEGIAKGTGILWSLAVEEHFYIVFPLLFTICRFLRPTVFAIILFASCALLLAWRCVLVYQFQAPEDRAYIATDTRIDSILFGCILAVWHNPVLDKPLIGRHWFNRVVLPAAIVAIILTFFYRNTEFRQTFRYSIQGLALMPVFVAAIRDYDRLLFSWLNWKAVRFIGLLSYSLYLVHFVVLNWTWHWVGSRLTAALVAGCIIFTIAVGIYYGVERPLARLRKRWSAVKA